MQTASAESQGHTPGVATRGARKTVVIRNRPAWVNELHPQHGPSGQTSTLAWIHYLDGRQPRQEQLVWESEFVQDISAESLPSALPGSASSPPEVLRAAFAAQQLNGAIPPLVEHGTESAEVRHARIPVLGTVEGDVTPLAYQWVPLELALQQPQVRLLIADDVGLGKTLEAALVIKELVVRRRAQRILVLAPPTLLEQWRDELKRAIGLEFRILDGNRSRRRAGTGNPFDQYPYLLSSYYYLKQPHVLREFMQPCGQWQRPRLPWDLLVVDEVHRLATFPGHKPSQLNQMLTSVAPWFEHRLFLSATPHNGYTSSLTGLLQVLDPFRFRKTMVMTTREREQMATTVVRRTTASIPETEIPDRLRVAIRHELLRYVLTPDERSLYDAVSSLCMFLGRLSPGSSGASDAPELLSSLLRTRLLSSQAAFRSTFQWANNALRQTLGARFPGLEKRLEQIEALLRTLENSNAPDSKSQRLLAWLDSPVARTVAREGRGVVVFSQYLDSLDDLANQLENTSVPLLRLDGRLNPTQQQELVRRFTSPGAGFRVLLATDVASEGINLHSYSSHLLHWDLPWNPARLLQRNGRITRIGQAHEVLLMTLSNQHPLERSFRDRVSGKARILHGDLDDAPVGQSPRTFAGTLIPAGPLLAPPPSSVCRRTTAPRIDEGRRWVLERLGGLPLQQEWLAREATSSGGPRLWPIEADTPPRAGRSQSWLWSAISDASLNRGQGWLVLQTASMAINLLGEPLFSWPVFLFGQTALRDRGWVLEPDTLLWGEAVLRPGRDRSATLEFTSFPISRGWRLGLSPGLPGHGLQMQAERMWGDVHRMVRKAMEGAVLDMEGRLRASVRDELVARLAQEEEAHAARLQEFARYGEVTQTARRLKRQEMELRAQLRGKGLLFPELFRSQEVQWSEVREELARQSSRGQDQRLSLISMMQQHRSVLERQFSLSGGLWVKPAGLLMGLGEGAP